MEREMNQLYPIIAEQILGMIPTEDWYEIYLYAEILDDSRNVYFYFKTSEKADYIYSHDIPQVFNVSEEIYDDLLKELRSEFEKLRQVFIKNDQEAWTNLTFTLKYPGKFQISYNYDDVINCEIFPTQRQMIFEYQNLGILPNNERDKNFVLEYVKNQTK